MSFPIKSSGPIQSSSSNVQSSPQVLKEGQMVHGQIKQLFPGQMAEVQIGDQKLIAKLEVPMKAGDAYYFRVNSVKPELQLKIIAGPTTIMEGQTRQLGSVIDALQLPKTAEMTTLLSFIIQNKMSLNRDGLLQAELFLKSVPTAMQAEALVSIQKMTELKLPFTETVFRALLSVESKEGLQTVLTALRGLITSDPTVPPRAQEAIVSILDKITKPFGEAVGSALLGKSFMVLLDSSENSETRFKAVQLLRSAAVLPEQTSLANLQQVLTSRLTSEPSATLQGQPVTAALPVPQSVQDVLAILRQVNNTPTAPMNVSLEGLKALISKAPEISVENKERLTSIVDGAVSSRPSVEATNRFVQEFGQALIRGSAENLFTSPFRADASVMEPKEQLLMLLSQRGQADLAGNLTTLVQNAERSADPVVQQLVQSAEGAVANAVGGQVVKDAIQMIIRSLGLNYEATLLGKEPDIGRLVESLKPQLIALMQDPTVSQAVRDSAEAVVMRMNGPLLLSGENGVQHQLMTQIPLEFFGKRIDATLEWNGRMKDDGKIDPDFARILFYLDLESLDRTVIDMQVQNRIVSITIFTADLSAQKIGIARQEKLSAGLNSVGYKLSGVFFKDFTEEKKDAKRPKYETSAETQGVDFRI